MFLLRIKMQNKKEMNAGWKNALFLCFCIAKMPSRLRNTWRIFRLFLLPYIRLCWYYQPGTIFFFCRKLRERKTQPSKMQKSKSILGIFETQIHTFGTNVTFWWLWFSIGALFIRSIAKHFQQYNRHCFIPIRACRNICMWTKPVFLLLFLIFAKDG